MSKYSASIRGLNLLLVMVLAGMFTACNEGDNKINIAFQSEEDGRWGMMTTSGKVIFEDEFERMPSVAINGYFTVKNGNGMWEIYSAEEKPQQVGNEYLYVGPFVDGVAPVVEKGKPITLINTEGKVVTTLDKLSGKTVKAMTAFQYGRAIFQIEDEEFEELYGMIDTKGKVLIEPEYPVLHIDGGMVVGRSKKNVEKDQKDDSDMIGEIIVFNLNGKEQSRINMKKNDVTDFDICGEGLFKATVGEGSSRKVGLMNEKGEWVVKPNTKVKDIGDVLGKKFVYYNGERYGLMNYDGDVLVRAKYIYLKFVADNVLAAMEYNGDDSEVKLISLEGEDICNDTWEALISLGDGNMLAKEGSNSWVIINAKGEVVSDKTFDIYDYNLGYNDRLYSDYFDVAAMLSKLSITKSGVCGLGLGAGVEDVVTALEKETDRTYNPDYYLYYYQQYFSFDKDLGETTATISIGFPGSLIESCDSIAGNWWSEAKAAGIIVKIPSRGKMRDHESEVYKAIVSQLSTAGKVSEEGKKYTVISVGSDKSILITDEGSDGVHLLYLAVPIQVNTSGSDSDNLIRAKLAYLETLIYDGFSGELAREAMGEEEEVWEAGADSAAVDFGGPDTCAW